MEKNVLGQSWSGIKKELEQELLWDVRHFMKIVREYKYTDGLPKSGNTSTI